MRFRRGQLCSLFALAILRATSWLIPASGRRDWLAEWSAELWQVVHAGGSRTSPLSFVRGAIPDALCLRREAAFAERAESGSTDPATLPASPRTSPGPRRCLLVLASLCGLVFTLVLALPGSRRALLAHGTPASDELVLVTRHGFTDLDQPAIRFAQYQDWKVSTRHLYRELAFYQPRSQQLRLSSQPATEATVIRASSNLFELLGVAPLPIAPVTTSGHSRVILRRSLWKRAGEPSELEVAGRRLPIAGILPDGEWPLPGRADAWLLEDARALDATSPLARGYLLARIEPAAFPRGRRAMIDDAIRYPCLSLSEIAERPAMLFGFALILASLGLPATLPIPLGATARRTRRLRPRLRAWSYLAAKLVLILPLMYGVSLLAAFSGLPVESHVGPYLELAVAFFGLLFLFRWAWQDQRSRCPECLGRLSHPARVGLYSRSFLAWSGTELVCTSGHGLLHIPELPTSWFSNPRWLALDASWKPLFASPLP